jgi:hypothetical protein
MKICLAGPELLNVDRRKDKDGEGNGWIWRLISTVRSAYWYRLVPTSVPAPKTAEERSKFDVGKCYENCRVAPFLFRSDSVRARARVIFF